MAAIWASELLKLVPCIQLRDEKNSRPLELVLHSLLIVQCPPSWVDLLLILSFDFQNFPRLQSFKTKLELLLLRCFESVTCVTFPCRFCSFSCRAAGLTAVALHHLLSVVWPPKRRGFRCFKKLTLKDIQFSSSKPLQLKYQGHEFSSSLCVNDPLQISMPRFCKSLATSSFNISTESQLSFHSPSLFTSLFFFNWIWDVLNMITSWNKSVKGHVRWNLTWVKSSSLDCMMQWQYHRKNGLGSHWGDGTEWGPILWQFYTWWQNRCRRCQDPHRRHRPHRPHRPPPPPHHHHLNNNNHIILCRIAMLFPTCSCLFPVCVSWKKKWGRSPMITVTQPQALPKSFNQTSRFSCCKDAKWVVFCFLAV